MRNLLKGMAVITAVTVLIITGCNNSVDIPVNFINLTADGSSMVTTTKLILTFDKDITDLSAADITLNSGSTGANKGNLTRTGVGVYELAVSGITMSGSVTVAVSKFGYNITGGVKTVFIIFVYTVNFNINGGNGTTPQSQSSSTITLPDGSGFSRSGYTFGGWNTNTSGAGTNYSAGSSYTPTDNITLYARWTAVVEMVYISGGSFQMGSTSGDSYEWPVHTVTLSGFSMGKYEVTQAQYQSVMGTNPSYFSSSPASGEVQENRPVEYVSWYDAVVFCNKLSMAEGLNPAYSISGSTNPSSWGSVPTRWRDSTWDAVQIVSGSNGYRLPTEAQWEYAAKGGNGSPGNYTYSGSNTVGDVAWYSGNSNETHEVGKKAPNGLGLYDMSGNVYEWCWDWYGNYQSEAQTDPQGAASGYYRVKRGGSWFISYSLNRSAARSYVNPLDRYDNIGFRLVRP